MRDPFLRATTAFYILFTGFATYATPFISADCTTGHQDSTCLKSISGGAIQPPPTGELRALYDGALAGVPSTGFHYWGFDFQSVDGIYSPVQRSMYVNRSNELVSITLTFDIPSGPCGSGCMPGIEFKVGGWHSFFPNIVRANNTAEATLEVGPNDSYGWVIGLWSATNPRLTVVPHGTDKVSMADVGLPEAPNSVEVTPGATYPCGCPDGTTAQCYTGSQYSTGYVGPWSNDYYHADGAGNTCPAAPTPGLLR
jgi:hypothetical protein